MHSFTARLRRAGLAGFLALLSLNACAGSPPPSAIAPHLPTPSASTAAASEPLAAPTVSALQSSLQARFAGDRTGVCVVAAVVDAQDVQRERFCARPRTGREPVGGPGLDAAFEIGSVSKTLLALLVADLVQQGRWTLDDPLAKHLPPGVQVPRQADRPVRVRDLLTHSAGLPALPPGWQPADPANPYASLSEDQLLAALARTTFSSPIGSRAAYSNFGMMLLSAAVARATGGDLEAALQSRVFKPLGMRGAYIRRAPAGTRAAAGHLPTGEPTPAWTIAPNLAGVGMVRARLDDLVAYVQAHLGHVAVDPATRAALQLTQQPLAHGFAMNWVHTRIQGHTVLLHEGGTGGFSSLVAMRPEQGRAVVLLADAALSDLGGLVDIGLPLLGLDLPIGRPRIEQPVPADLLAGLPGDYELAGLRLKLSHEDGLVWLASEGRPRVILRHDSHGDLYPLGVSALLTPTERRDGRLMAFAWRQGGGMMEARRAGAAPALTASNPAWRDWAGEYPLAPGFALRVFERDGRLKLQGTAQPALDAEVTGPDRVEIKALGVVLEFQRDASGTVTAATLRQGGQVLQGRKQ